MYLDLEDLPFAIFKSGEELLSAIVRDCKDADTTKRNDIYSDFYRDTLEAFPFVPEQDIFEVLLNDKEANWLRYHSATVDAGSSASVLICKNCYTESDFREVSLRADLLQSTILMIPSKSFSAALRNLIFEDSGETFDAFVVTRGKSSRTYFEALKEFFMSGEQKRAESRIRRVSRYLPGIEVGEIEVIDPFEMRQEA